MATYAIGDIQGCYDALQALLKKIKFNTDKDTLWLTGDIVHRGGQSLETLKYIFNIRHNIISVLGNHDLHLMAAFYGEKSLRKDSDLLPIINAKHSAKYIKWLCSQPLLHHEGDYVMTHAGIAPMWTLKQAKQYAAEVEIILRSQNKKKFLKNMYGDKPEAWSDELTAYKRLRCIVNHFTRMRYVTHLGHLEFKSTMHPKDAPEHLTPWYNFPNRPLSHQKLIIGHWASLIGESEHENIIALDTGCVWGGKLTALNLETNERTQV